MSVISTSHVAHINESCPLYQQVMSLISMRCVKKSRPPSHVPYESCPSYQWVTTPCQIVTSLSSRSHVNKSRPLSHVSCKKETLNHISREKERTRSIPALHEPVSFVERDVTFFFGLKFFSQHWRCCKAVGRVSRLVRGYCSLWAPIRCVCVYV